MQHIKNKIKDWFIEEVLLRYYAYRRIEKEFKLSNGAFCYIFIIDNKFLNINFSDEMVFRCWGNENKIANRIGKPAVIGKKHKEWFVNGKFHREDGPAVYLRGKKPNCWFWEGWYVTEEDHPFNVFRNKYNLPKNIKKWPIEYRELFTLTYNNWRPKTDG